MKPEANSLSLFKFKNSDIRVVQIAAKPWFAGTDICAYLGIVNTGNAYRRLGDMEKTNIRRVDVGMRAGRDIIFVSESGLYSLVMRSDKKSATEFQNWVTRVVLPAIRKDGGYIHGEEHVVSGAMTEDELVFKAMEVMKRKVDRLSAEKGKGRSLDHCDPLFQPLARGPSGLAPREQSQTSLIGPAISSATRSLNA